MAEKYHDYTVRGYHPVTDKMTELIFKTLPRAKKEAWMLYLAGAKDVRITRENPNEVDAVWDFIRDELVRTE